MRKIGPDCVTSKVALQMRLSKTLCKALTPPCRGALRKPLGLPPFEKVTIRLSLGFVHSSYFLAPNTHRAGRKARCP